MTESIKDNLDDIIADFPGIGNIYRELEWLIDQIFDLESVEQVQKAFEMIEKRNLPIKLDPIFEKYLITNDVELANWILHKFGSRFVKNPDMCKNVYNEAYMYDDYLRLTATPRYQMFLGKFGNRTDLESFIPSYDPVIKIFIRGLAVSNK